MQRNLSGESENTADEAAAPADTSVTKKKKKKKKRDEEGAAAAADDGQEVKQLHQQFTHVIKSVIILPKVWMV